MVLLHPPDQLRTLGAEGLRSVPAQLIDAQHQVELSVIQRGQRIHQGHLPHRRLHGFAEHGLHGGSREAQEGAVVQAAVQPQSLCAGIPQKDHIVEVCILYRRALRYRSGPDGFLRHLHHRSRDFLHRLLQNRQFRPPCFHRGTDRSATGPSRGQQDGHRGQHHHCPRQTQPILFFF